MTDIESNCQFEMSDNDTAEVSACEVAGTGLTNAVDDCIKPSKTLAESCTCFMGLSTANLDIVKSCNISGKNDAAKEAKKKCTEGDIPVKCGSFLFCCVRFRQV